MRTPFTKRVSTPEQIDTYLEAGGYSSLLRVLLEEPAWVVDQVKSRGCAAEAARVCYRHEMGVARQTAAERRKILVCNADEGDPGAYMDRSVLEGNPHSIIEGMLIGARATGAITGIVYVRTNTRLP